jgi:microcystin-dependent protein
VGASVTAYYLSVETGGVPVGIETAGVIVAWSSTLAIPTGWLECDGSAVSRTTYVDLFGAIGTTYGVGDGSSTFNLPDFEQSFYDPVSGALVTLTAIIKY